MLMHNLLFQYHSTFNGDNLLYIIHTIVFSLLYCFIVMSLCPALQAVSFEDEGIYNCFSRGVRKNDFAIKSVRMIVQKDWEEEYETDTGVSI